MEVKEYLDKMIEVQNIFLTYLDDENINQNSLIVLINYIDDQRIRQDKHHLTSFLHLFSSIVDYHHRTRNYFDKSFQIILNFFRNNCKIIQIWKFLTFFATIARLFYFLLKKK
ncbi:hypothetical protein M9Y10_023622 [Tritrichomonas musculus]|uniref:Uncharacterized protein n=1 Tax=Tritrichomonas musculus TaxID=1915356 RepID=A0ABR2KVM7_9EUKA